MGQYDDQIEKAQRWLKQAQLELEEAERAMADKAPSVREYVLDFKRREVADKQFMLDTFTEANEHGI